MRTLIATVLLLLTITPAKAGLVSISTWFVPTGALLVIVVDEMRSHQLPTCEAMKKENHAAWKLQHGGWNNNKTHFVLKTCR